MSQNKRATDVVVLCPNGRRVKVKISGSTCVGQIIEEACLKHNLDPLNYNIKHLKRILDPSNTVQYSNIPNLAQLELIEAVTRRKEEPVTVHLVTDTGQRFISEHPSNSTLWDALTNIAKTENFKFSTDMSETVPVVVYTMRKIVGEELKSVTLKSLGLFGGKCMMRYHTQPSSCDKSIVIVKVDSIKASSKSDVEKTGDKLSSNVISTDKCQTSLASMPSGESALQKPCKDSFSTPDSLEPSLKPTCSSREPSNISESLHEPMECEEAAEDHTDAKWSDEKMDLQGDSIQDADSNVREELLETKETLEMINDVQEQNTNGNNSSVLRNPDEEVGPDTLEASTSAVIPFSERGAILFSMDDAPPPEQSQEDDEFFDLTVEEIRSLYRDQVKQLQEMEEAPLLTKQLRQLEKDSKLLAAMNKHPVTQLRICFPDRLVIQANFKPRNTIQEVMDFLKPLLITSDLQFYLYTLFPRMTLEPQMTLVEAGCIPKARVYFGTEHTSPFLNEDTLSKKSSFEAATKAVVKSRYKANRTPVNGEKKSGNSDTSKETLGNQTSNAVNTPPKKINPPKWFKLGGH